jgi:tellurite resistance protein
MTKLELESMRQIVKTCKFATSVMSAMTPDTNEQISAWLRGLLTIAWADGNFDAEEQKLISVLAHNGDSISSSCVIEPITPIELAAAFKHSDSTVAEDFLRTAVMVAIADGVYSICEANLLHEFCQALGLSETALDSLRPTLYDHEKGMIPNFYLFTQIDSHALRPIRNWLDENSRSQRSKVFVQNDPRSVSLRARCQVIWTQDCPYSPNVQNQPRIRTTGRSTLSRFIVLS